MHQYVDPRLKSLNPKAEAAESDAALVASTLAGGATAYDRLVRRYERSTRAICFGVLRDWHAAEDAAQDAFVSAYNNLRSLRNPAGFGTWLLTIARHRATRLLRSRRAYGDLSSCPEPAARSSEPTADTILELMARLPEHERVVATLRYIDGHDVGTIANICQRPTETVRKQLYRAHERLKRVLERGDHR